MPTHSGQRTGRAALRICTIIALTVSSIVFIAPSSRANHPSTRYTIQNLGALGTGNGSAAMAVNRFGQVAGYSYTQEWNTIHGFIWSRGTMTDVGALVSEYDYSFARDVNDRGQVVGESLVSTSECGAGRNHAFLWSHAVIQDLGTVGGCDSGAAGINNMGWVVGFSTTSEGGFHAALWMNGKVIDLGTLGGSYSSAQGINDRGQVVGLSENAAGELHAFMWWRGRMRDLGTLGGSYSAAIRINALGQVVGEAVAPDGSMHAVLWSRGQLIDLGTFGGLASTAAGINDQGDIVGTQTDSQGVQHPFLWRRGEITYVEGFFPADSGWTSLSVTDISNRGDIVGAGWIGDVFRGYRLTPTGVR